MNSAQIGNVQNNNSEVTGRELHTHSESGTESGNSDVIPRDTKMEAKRDPIFISSPDSEYE